MRLQNWSVGGAAICAFLIFLAVIGGVASAQVSKSATSSTKPASEAPAQLAVPVNPNDLRRDSGPKNTAADPSRYRPRLQIPLPPPPAPPQPCLDPLGFDCDNDGYAPFSAITAINEYYKKNGTQPRNRSGYQIQVGVSDCNDFDATAHPGATEVADYAAHDEDCDPTTFGKRDADGDGYFDAGACNRDPGGRVYCGDDCNDNDNRVHPNQPEVCNGKDDNCDGAIDDEVLTAGFFRDVDGDGFGDAKQPVYACYQTAGTSAFGTDCDDKNALKHPGQYEIANGQDDNCNGVADEAPLFGLLSGKN